ncbi:MAG: PD40 domain-containing protein [Planctomycetes bacterium]|nr:PD40 domain-containing protein [Planctomycetota bacterium]
MKRVTLVSLTVCLILVIVSGTSVSTLADIASETITKAEQHFEKANELLNRKKYKAAIAEFEEVMNISPNSKIAQDAQFWMGQSHFMAGQFDAAQATFAKLIEQYPASAIVPATELMAERVGRAKDIEEKRRAIAEARMRLAALLRDIGNPELTVRRVWAGAADPHFSGAPSPDGKYLSYVAWRTGDLAVHELASGKNRQLTNEGWDKGFAVNSVFSPDSKQVAYYWWSNEKVSGELRIVGLDGSGPRVINLNNETAIRAPLGWTADGKHILASCQTEDKSLQILLVPVGDGSVRVLKDLGKRLPDVPRPLGVCLSPDGRYVAYTFLPSEDSANRDISVLAVDGSRDIPLVKHPADDFVLGWAPDGKRVVFASDRTGSMGIWAIEVADGKPQGTPQLLKPEIGQFRPLGFTENGSYYYGVSSEGSNVYVATYDPQKGNVTGKPVLTVKHYEGSNGAPDWSPDGRYLACVSRRPGVDQVFLIHSVETGEVRELSPDLKDFKVYSHRWSPDGRSLLGAVKTKDGGLLKIDVETGEVTIIVEGPGLFCPNWSADGKAVFYVRRAIKGWRILRRDLTTNEEKELFRPAVGQNGVGAILGLALSPDGKQLAFQDLDAGMLKVLSVVGDQPRELVKFKGKATIAWEPDGSHLLYANRMGKKLWRISAGGGEPQELDLEMPSLNHVRFHPDGRRITFTARAEGKIEVWVMENFLPESTAVK